MPRVLINDNLEAPGLDLLRQAGIDIDERRGLKGDALKAALRECDGLIVRSGTQLTADYLDDPGKLRAVVRAGVGVDNIDVAAATRKGIVVMNTPGGNTVSTAEHTVTLLMAVARLLPAADASLRAGKWERGKFVGSQLAGKTLGIIGLGRIGREVARRALAFDMKVVGTDPFLAPERAAQLGIESVPDLDALLPRCDFLTVHVPGGPETRDMIGAAQLAKLPRRCPRHQLRPRRHLQRGGAGSRPCSRATSPAPPSTCSPRSRRRRTTRCFKLPNVVVTPHLGASTVEAQTSVAREAAQLLIDFLQRGVVGFAVNMAAVDRTELEELRLYVDMARRLGLLHAQMAQGAIKRAELTFRGEVARRGTKLITAAFTAGLLEYRLDQTVNIVNAELLARERGIELVEQSNPKKGDFSTLIRADVVTDKKTYTAAATLFGNRLLRLVQLGPYHLDSYMDGVMLIFTHHDVPGLIGYIGTIFGKHYVNIAQMTVGRQMPGGEAIAVLNLDSPPPEAALAEVRGHPQISSVSVVKLPPAGQMPAWFG